MLHPFANTVIFFAILSCFLPFCHSMKPRPLYCQHILHIDSKSSETLGRAVFRISPGFYGFPYQILLCCSCSTSCLVELIFVSWLLYTDCICLSMHLYLPGFPSRRIGISLFACVTISIPFNDTYFASWSLKALERLFMMVILSVCVGFATAISGLVSLEIV